MLARPHVRNFGGRPAFSQKVLLRFVPRPHLLCEAEVEGFSHCVVHAYGESKVMAGKWCQVYAHAAADNSYVELRDGSAGSILNGRMDDYGEYQGFSFGYVYGSGLTHVLDSSYEKNQMLSQKTNPLS